MKKIIYFLIVLAIASLIIISVFYYKIQSPLFTEDSPVFLKSEGNPQTVFQKLKSENRISSEIVPIYLAKLKKLKKLKKGYYFFKKGTSCNTFINTLRSGRQTPIKVTFNNTRTIEDFAGKIARQIDPDSLTLLHFLQNDSVAKSYGFDKANFIGMFLPNTYEMYYTTTPQTFTKRMHKEYERFWNSKRKEKANQLGYTPQQISSLAAIVDEETNKNDEKACIAGVYLNRLKREIPLQADPTLKFAVGDFSLKRILNV
ncbi:MAG: aminodeoxychorismate lyase, partial [Bacteroidia bacterium]